MKHLTKFVLVLFLWERKTWSNLQAGHFIPVVGSDLLFSPPVRALHFSQRHVLPFFPCSVCYGDQIWKQNLSCDSISVDEISFESCSSLLCTFNSETQHCFFPAGLLKNRSRGVDFIMISKRILIPFSHKSVCCSPVTVCQHSA